MTTFDNRESAFENKFAHDEEMLFRAQARANNILGLWAAGLLGKSGDDAEAYAKTVVVSDMEEAGSEDVFRKLAADLGDKVGEAALRTRMLEALSQAKTQLVDES